MNTEASYVCNLYHILNDLHNNRTLSSCFHILIYCKNY